MAPSRLRSWSSNNKKVIPVTEVPPPVPPPILLGSFGFEFDSNNLPDTPPDSIKSIDESNLKNKEIIIENVATVTKSKPSADGNGVIVPEKGLKGFFGRVRSNSEGGKNSDKLEKKELVPPVPSLPPIVFSNGSQSVKPLPLPKLATALPIVATGGSKFSSTKEIRVEDVEGNAFSQFAEEEDLASLIYLVHSAGDKFTTNSNSNYNYNSDPSTPNLSNSSSSEFSSPSQSERDTTPYYSFLSHYNNQHHSRERIKTPPPIIKTIAATPDSDDDYGSDDNGPKSNSKNKSLWSKKDNIQFSKAKAEMRTPGSRTKPIVRRRALGSRATIILNLSSMKLEGKESSLLYPLSNNQYPIPSTAHSTPTLVKILFRTKMVKKLRNGVTLLEELELEKGNESRGGYRNSFDSDQSDWSTGSRGKLVQVEEGELEAQFKKALDLFDPIVQESRMESKEIGFGIQSDKELLGRPKELPTIKNILDWMKRDSFIISHLIILPTQSETFLLDLIRPRIKSQSITFSTSLKGLAGQYLFKTEPKTFRQDSGFGERPEREILPGFGERRKTSKDLSAIKRRTTGGFGQGPKILLPGPLLLQALAESNVAKLESDEIVEEEDELPLATLRNRVSTLSPSISATFLLEAQEKNRLEHLAELEASQAESAMLTAEISRLQTNEIIRKERQEKLDRSREETNYRIEQERKDLEIENWQKRKLAEQQRRARIMDLPTIPIASTEIVLNRDQERMMREQKRRSRAMGVGGDDDGSSTTMGGGMSRSGSRMSMMDPNGMTRSGSRISISPSMFDQQQAMSRSNSRLSFAPSNLDFQNGGLSPSPSFNRPISSLSFTPSMIQYSPQSIPNSPLWPSSPQQFQSNQFSPTFPNQVLLSPTLPNSYHQPQQFYSQNEFSNSAPNLNYRNSVQSFSQPGILRRESGNNYNNNERGDYGDSPTRRERMKTAPSMKNLPFDSHLNEPLPSKPPSNRTRPISFAPDVRPTSPELSRPDGIRRSNSRNSLIPPLPLRSNSTPLTNNNVKRSSTLSRSNSQANLSKRNSTMNLNGIENASPPRESRRDPRRDSGRVERKGGIISLAESMERARDQNFQSAKRGAGR